MLITILSMLGGNSVFIILEGTEILTTMIGFSRESEHQQKKRDDLSSILHVCCSHHDQYYYKVCGLLF